MLAEYGIPASPIHQSSQQHRREGWHDTQRLRLVRGGAAFCPSRPPGAAEGAVQRLWCSHQCSSASFKGSLCGPSNILIFYCLSQADTWTQATCCEMQTSAIVVFAKASARRKAFEAAQSAQLLQLSVPEPEQPYGLKGQVYHPVSFPSLRCSM